MALQKIATDRRTDCTLWPDIDPELRYSRALAKRIASFLRHDIEAQQILRLADKGVDR